MRLTVIFIVTIIINFSCNKDNSNKLPSNLKGKWKYVYSYISQDQPPYGSGFNGYVGSKTYMFELTEFNRIKLYENGSILTKSRVKNSTIKSGINQMYPFTDCISNSFSFNTVDGKHHEGDVCSDSLRVFNFPFESAAGQNIYINYFAKAD